MSPETLKAEALDLSQRLYAEERRTARRRRFREQRRRFLRDRRLERAKATTPDAERQTVPA